MYSALIISSVVSQAMNLELLPESALPKTSLVDALATEMKRLKDKGIEEPFVHVDITKWLPVWCDDGPNGR